MICLFKKWAIPCDFFANFVFSLPLTFHNCFTNCPSFWPIVRLGPPRISYPRTLQNVLYFFVWLAVLISWHPCNPKYQNSGQLKNDVQTLQRRGRTTSRAPRHGAVWIKRSHWLARYLPRLTISRVLFKINLNRLHYKTTYLFVECGSYLACQWLLFI